MDLGFAQRLVARADDAKAGFARKLSQEQRNEIVRRYADGESKTALAREFEVSYTAIDYHVKRAVERSRRLLDAETEG